MTKPALAAAVAALALAVAGACSKSHAPGDFPADDVYVMDNGGFFVREDGEVWRRYGVDGEKTPAEWLLIDSQEGWYLVKNGSVTVAIPKDRDPQKFLRQGDGETEWHPYGMAIGHGGDGGVAEEKTGSGGDDGGDGGTRGWSRDTGVTARDYGLMADYVEGTEDFCMMADNGDQIHVSMTMPANDYGNLAMARINVYNLEGWVYCSDQSTRRDRGDYWQFGGPFYVATGVMQARPYLYIAKDWSWVQVTGVDGVFNCFVTREKFDHDSRALRAELRAQGITPRSPMGEILDNAQRITDSRMEQLMDEIRAEADGLGAGHSKPSGTRGRGREYVRVKQYAPNYTGSDERVYCRECGEVDFPHIHVNRVR